jgi:RHS repeat-associated protein
MRDAARVVDTRGQGMIFRNEVADTVGHDRIGSARRLISIRVALWALLCCLLLPVAAAMAQESSHNWTVPGDGYVPAQTFPTLGQAEAAMRARTSAGVYPKLREVLRRTITDKKIELTYWMGSDPSVLQPWVYSGAGVQAANDTDVIQAYLSYYDQQSISDGCPTGATRVNQDPYVRSTYWQDDVTRSERSKVTFQYQGEDTVISGHQCVQLTSDDDILRIRTRCMDPSKDWKADNGQCENRDSAYTFTIVSSPLACATCGLAGDPTDVTTGDQFETEQDFDLGWISLERYYHSATSNGESGFGPGWTHSHLLSLAIDSSGGTIGLVRPNGSHLPFKRLAAGLHEATDGSGMRLNASGTNWVMQGPDGTTTFDKNGRVSIRNFDDGTSLTYAYDGASRLSTITHSTGRSLVFNYADGASNASLSSISSAGVGVAVYTYKANKQVATASTGSTPRRYFYENTTFPFHLTTLVGEDNVRIATFTYDSQGRAICNQRATSLTCDPATPGTIGKTTITYTATGGAIVTDPLSHQSTYGLTPDTGGEPRQVSGVADTDTPTVGIGRTYNDATTDFRRRLALETDRNGTQTQHTYSETADTIGGVSIPVSVHIVNEASNTADARTVETHRDLATNRLVYMKQGNRETRIERNARQQPTRVSVTDSAVGGATRTTDYTYCEVADVAATNSTCPLLGLPKTVNGPRTDLNDTTTYIYYGSDDATCATAPATCPHRKGDLWKVSNALGQATEILKYDAQGRPLSVKDLRGVITDTEYDARGRPTARKMRGTDNAVETDDLITRIEYKNTGEVKKVTQPDGAYVDFTYDALHRLTDLTDNSGATIHYVLDNAGNRIGEDTKDSMTGTTVKRSLARAYDALGRLTTLDDATITDFTYDNNGNLDTITDVAGRVTNQDYDGLNRLTQTRQDVGGIDAKTKFQYDVLDNLVQVTDPNNLNTVYTYNGLGDLMQLTSPDTGTATYTYDSAGNRKTAKDARNIVTTYVYDVLNRVISIARPGETTVQYAYTPFMSCPASELFGQGRLSRITDQTGTTDYCYDRFGRVVRKIQVTNSKTFVVRYAYTPGGRLASMTYPDGALVEYTRDPQGRATAIDVTPSGQAKRSLLNQISYAPLGPVTGWTYAGGRSLSRTYDDSYRPTSVLDAATGGLSLGYEYNNVGDLTSLKDASLTTAQAGYHYDALGRLTQSDGPTGGMTETYTYDATGNRTSFGASSGGTTTYTYAAGSHKLSSVGSVARTYDLAGNTTAIGSASSSVYDGAGRLQQATLGGTVTNYRTNGLGERVQRYTTDAATTSVYNAYDESGHWLGEYGPGGTGTARQQVIWLDDMPVGLLQGVGAAQTLLYIEADHLGTPRAIIDPTRSVAIWTWDIKSEAFGNTYPNQNPDGDGTNFRFDLRFPGQRYDDGTGMFYNYLRDGYQPGLGRYSQPDPIGQAGGVSIYGYVGGGPISGADPLGMKYAELYARYGMIGGAGGAAIASVVVDAGTGGLNIVLSPLELALGALAGGSSGYALGTLVDLMSSSNSASGDNVIPFPTKAKEKTKSDVDGKNCPKSPDDGSWCATNRKQLISRYMPLAGMMNSGLIPGLQYNQAARLYNENAKSHNKECPSYIVPLLPLVMPRGV